MISAENEGDWRDAAGKTTVAPAAAEKFARPRRRSSSQFCWERAFSFSAWIRPS